MFYDVSFYHILHSIIKVSTPNINRDYKDREVQRKGVEKEMQVKCYSFRPLRISKTIHKYRAEAFAQKPVLAPSAAYYAVMQPEPHSKQ